MIEWFDNFWNLYTTTFPLEERRNIDNQKKLFENPQYNADPVYFNNEWAGFISWWNFKEFIYIEHFAIDSIFRNKGIGESLLKSFTKKYHTIVLEVEYPEDELSKRRVGFYERLGFRLLDNEYLQPAYDDTKQPVPLKIMIFPGNSNLEFETIRDTLYKKVYLK